MTPNCCRGLVGLVVVLAGFGSLTGAGEFDRVEGARLEALTRDPATKARNALTFREMEALPEAFKDSRAAFLVVKTGQGNFARLLVVPGLRKPATGDGPPLPVVLLERFDTFEPGRSGSRPARGANLLLFEGFHLDLDAGQVVPEGQGGDLVFRAGGPAGPRLEPVGPARLFTVSGPVVTEPSAGEPSPGKAVVPSDFAGRYRLQADGRWFGLLELRVDAERRVTGRFRSEAKGTSYPVTGEVAAEPSNKVTFTVKFPRTEQAYDAFLFTEGKAALAGSFHMLDRPFGFHAVREGAKPESPE